MIRAGVIADVQTGSAYAPWPPDFESSTFGKVLLNQGQTYLLDNWQRIAKEIPSLDLLFLNGDEIEGQQPKDEARYVIEPEPQSQARAFLRLIEPFHKRVKKGGETYCTEGTAYHMGDCGTWSEYIAEQIGAIPMAGAHFCWDWLLLDVAGKHLDVAHRQSVTIAYKTTTQERELNFSEMHKIPADLVIRSHNHTYSWIELPREDRLQYYLSTPAWQLQTHYCRTSISPNRKDGTLLGMVVIEIDRDGTISKKPFLFEHPPMRRAEYVKARIHDAGR